MSEIHVYPVGTLRQLIRLRKALDPRSLHAWGHPDGALWHRGWRRSTVRHAIRCIRTDARRRSAWNGYLAEPTSEDVFWTHCGHGWTKRRATASLIRHIGEVNPEMATAPDWRREPSCQDPRRSRAEVSTNPAPPTPVEEKAP